MTSSRFHGYAEEIDFGIYSVDRRDPNSRMQDGYRRKYVALKRKCDSLELSNERVLNRLCHVKKYIHKLSRERRGLMKKLTELGDEFKKSDLTIPLEDDLPGSMLGVSDSPSASFPSAGDGMGGFSPGVAVKMEEPSIIEQPQPPPPTSTMPVVHPRPSKKKRSREVGKSDKEKDPNAPKKPANAFLMYCQQERQKVQDGEGNGIYSADISHQELTRQLAKQWKFLSEDEKKHYYLMYEKEKDRYDKAVKKYAKLSAGAEKKSPKLEADVESETIDVVKLSQEKCIEKRDLKENTVTLKAVSSEDVTIDVEKDEFEFTDYPIEVEEPKICLEKIDKSKLFDKSRLFGLTSDSKSDTETSGRLVRDLFLRADQQMPPRSVEADLKVPSVLEVKTSRVEAQSASIKGTMKTLPGVQIKPTSDVRIRDLPGMSSSISIETQISQPMMELKSPGKSVTEDRTVLVTALKNKPSFDMKTKSIPEVKPKPPTDLVAQGSPDNKGTAIVETKSKNAVENKSRLITDMKAKPTLDSKPKVSSELKSKPLVEVKSKPFGLENRSTSSSDIKMKPISDLRRLSLDNRRPVVELKKFALDPSDDPYHFDD